MAASNFAESLNAIIEARHMLKHPFYQLWAQGRLSKETLKQYAIQYARHVEAFPTYVSAVHANTPDLEVRQALLENLVEEERGPDNHPELWLRFIEGLGGSRAEVTTRPALPATAQLVETFRALTREGSYLEGLTALYAYEAQIPAVATTKMEGLRKFYGIDDPRALAFFEVHRTADIDHAITELTILRRHATTPDDQEAVLAAARQSTDALWSFLDGVMSAYVAPTEASPCEGKRLSAQAH